MEKKVYNANELDMEVEVKPEKKEEPNKVEAKKDPEEEDEETEKDKTVETKKEAKKPSSEKNKDPEDEDEDESEEDDIEDKKSKKLDPDEEEETEEDKILNSSIETRLGKKYGIKNFKELQETLDVVDEALNNQKDLLEQLDQAKKAEPKLKFPSKDHEAAYEFIKEVPKGLQPERLITLAELKALDVDNADPKQVLRQQYILKHPELTREEVDLKFERFYEKKYTVDPEAFDNDEKRQKEEKLAKITMKSDVAKAKVFISTQKEKFKVTEDKEEQPEEVNESVKKSIARNAKEMDEFLDGFDKIVVPMKDGGKVKFALTDEMKKTVRTATDWIKNPTLYTPKGELKGFDPAETALSAAFALFHKTIIPEIWKQASVQSSKKSIEELAETKPTRKAKGPNVDKMQRREEDQWDDLMKNKENKKKQRVAA